MKSKADQSDKLKSTKGMRKGKQPVQQNLRRARKAMKKMVSSAIQDLIMGNGGRMSALPGTSRGGAVVGWPGVPPARMPQFQTAETIENWQSAWTMDDSSDDDGTPESPRKRSRKAASEKRQESMKGPLPKQKRKANSKKKGKELAALPRKQRRKVERKLKKTGEEVTSKEIPLDYEELERKVNQEKSKRPRCSRQVTYLTNAKQRSKRYTNRAKSILLAAKELEVQTRCSVSVVIQSAHLRGRSWVYKSKGFQIPQIAHAEMELGDSTVYENVLPAAPVETTLDAEGVEAPLQVSMQSVEVLEAPIVVVPSLFARNRDGCQVCGKEEDVGLWLKCGYTLPASGHSCPYMVHQTCVGLLYRDKEAADCAPYYCPKHIKAVMNAVDILSQASICPGLFPE